MPIDVLESLGVDDRADIGREISRVADLQFAHCALDHLDHGVGNAFMHAKQPQCRAALTGRAEGALQHRINHLLGQRAAIDQHGVDAAGLGDQRGDGTVFGGEARMITKS